MEQYILKVSSNKENIYINEGAHLPLTSTVCNKIDFANGAPLVFENISEETCLEDIKDTLIKNQYKCLYWNTSYSKRGRNIWNIM